MRRLKSVALWMFASCAVSLAVILPSSLNAVDVAPTGPGAVTVPQLLIDGAEVTLSATTDLLHAGDRAVLSVTARNTTDHSITISPTIAMNLSKLGDARSRVRPAPTQIWTDTPAITIAAGETASVKFDHTPQLSAASLVGVTVSGGGKSIVMLSFSIRS